MYIDLIININTLHIISLNFILNAHVDTYTLVDGHSERYIYTQNVHKAKPITSISMCLARKHLQK